jgi:hypothetical protein
MFFNNNENGVGLMNHTGGTGGLPSTASMMLTGTYPYQWNNLFANGNNGGNGINSISNSGRLQGGYSSDLYNNPTSCWTLPPPPPPVLPTTLTMAHQRQQQQQSSMAMLKAYGKN